MKKVIAISINKTNNQKLISYLGDSDISYVDNCILETICGFGGTPLLISKPSDVITFSNIISGIVLPGSFYNCDIKFYENQSELPEDFLIDKNKDNIDKYLVDLSIQNKIPLLAICRGIQTLNIALGGTLKYLNHNNLHTSTKAKKRHGLNHEVCLTDIQNSICSNIFSPKKDCVNGTHSVQISKVASLLSPTLKATDEGIEAIENLNHPFMLGVQFHPELRQSFDPKFKKIFDLFFQTIESQSKTN